MASTVVAGTVHHLSALQVMDLLMPPPGWVATAEEKRAYQLHLFRHAFEYGGSYIWRPSHDEVDPGGRTYDLDGPEIAHSEWRTGHAYADPPPSLVAARTPCMSADLGCDDDTGSGFGFEPYMRPAGRYLCRFRHVHLGQPPYGGDVPTKVRDQIGRWLGENAS